MDRVNLEKVGGSLRLTLTPLSKEEIPQTDDPPYAKVLDLLEEHLANGWESLRPEEIGALTDCPLILTDTAERDGGGNLLKVGTVYWHQNYQTEDPLDTLAEPGGLTLTGVPVHSE